MRAKATKPQRIGVARRLGPRQRGRLLGLILKHGPISRQQLSVLTGYAPATISRATAELAAPKLIREIGIDSSVTGAGRRPILLEVNPSSAYVAALHVGTLWLDTALVNLSGAIVARSRIGQRPDVSPAAALATAFERLLEIAGTAHIPLSSIFAVGIGSGGAVDTTSGILKLYPSLGWHDVPIRQLAQHHLRRPAIVDSNVNGIALAETWFGAGRGADAVLVLLVGNVINCALVLHNELYSTVHHGSGQIGHIQSDLDGPWCSCGNRGCLEAIASDIALVRQVTRERGAEQPTPLTMAAIMDEARAGNEQLRELLSDRAERVGRVLAGVVAVLDPDRLVVAGGAILDPELQLGPLQRSLDAHLYPPLRSRLVLQPSRFGGDVNVLGAAALGLNYLYSASPAWINSSEGATSHSTRRPA